MVRQETVVLPLEGSMAVVRCCVVRSADSLSGRLAAKACGEVSTQGGMLDSLFLPFLTGAPANTANCNIQ